MKQAKTACLLAVLLLVAISRARCGEDAAAAKPRLTVVTAAAHCDWAWGHSRAWHAQRYAEIIRNVLLLMRKYPHYVWQLENENEQLVPFLQKAGKDWPGMVEEFWQRVREGRIEVIVAISNPRISEVYPETFVRNLVLGKEYFRRHAPGIRQGVYHAVDLMCGHSQTPQILAGADYRYFMFSRPVRLKRVFWRTGLDGTRMLSVCQHYGLEGINVGGVKLESKSADDLLPSEDLAKAAEAWDPKTRLMATSARYFGELENSAARISEMQGVLDSLEAHSEGGLHGTRNLYVGCAQNQDLLLCLEKAQLMASMLGSLPPAGEMDRRWHDVLSCTGHAILFTLKDDYEERYAKVRRTRREAERAVADALAKVAGGIRFKKAAGSPLVVFNFHSWPVSGPVEFSLQGDTKGLILRDGSAREVPLQINGQSGSRGAARAAFVAGSVPACGYKTFYLSNSQGKGPAQSVVDPGRGPVENDHYRVKLAADGRLEVVDKSSGAPLGSPPQGGLGDLVFYDAPNSGSWVAVGPLGESHRWEIQPDRCRCVQGPVFASLHAEGTIGPHKLKREVRLWRRGRKLEYLVEIDAQPGSGVFCIRYPLGLSDGRVYAGIPFGAEPRENLQGEPFREEFFEKGYPHAYYATRWSDVSTADRGYTFICPPGMLTGYAYNRRKAGALDFILLRLWPMPKSGHWSSKCHPSTEGAGRHRWRCALVPHERSWREAATYRDALEQHMPLVAFSPSAGLRRGSVGRAEPPGGTKLDEAASLAEVAPASVVLSSLRLVKPADGGGDPEWELRLYETQGRPADVVVRLARPVVNLRRTNFLGEPSPAGGKIEVAGQRISFRILPWKIVTLRMSPKQTGR